MTKYSSLDPKLLRRLGGSELSALRLQLRRHFQRHGDNPEKTLLRLTKLSHVEYEAIALIVGLPTRFSPTVRIEIAQFDAALSHAEIAPSLRQALELLDGPIVNQSAVKAEQRARWLAVFSIQPQHATLRAWMQTTPAATLIKRTSRQDPDTAMQLLQQTDAVMQCLPAKGLTRAQLAADLFGNAHALDNGQPTATLVLAALRYAADNAAQAQDLPEDTTPEHDTGHPPAERTREIWARAGVLVNELARPALFLNLPVGSGFIAPAAPGEPGYLSLRQLLRTPVAWQVAGQSVYICENPNVVSIAADRLGSACAPLVCIDGMPAAAQRVLLTQLAEAGASLYYHGDFDWAGMHIANQVMQICGARPWRFQSQDYLQAIGTLLVKEKDLTKTVVTASWDASLIAEMQYHGRSVPEEAVVSLLVGDLHCLVCHPPEY